MKFKVIIFSIFVSLSLNAFAGGFSVGNGGGVIWCPGKQNYYTMDYLSRTNTSEQVKQIILGRTLENSLLRISNLMNTKLPQLKKSFDTYIQLLNNVTDFSKQYVWIPDAQLEAVPSDESYVFPSWCSGVLVGGLIDGWQVVVRKVNLSSPTQSVVFHYNPDVLAYIKKNGTQMSFLFVHEWLWNLTNSRETNRDLNYFLHSTMFDTYSAEQVQDFFKKAGVL